MANTIALKGNPIFKEGVAASAMKPGHLIVSRPRWGSQNGSCTLPASSAVVVNGVVLEDDIHGKGITDAYATNDNVRYGVFSKGSEVLLRVAAGAAAIAASAPLKVMSTGTVLTGIVNTDRIVAVALEAVDNSGGATEVFITCEIC